jgi:hypothetical protein
MEVKLADGRIVKPEEVLDIIIDTNCIGLIFLPNTLYLEDFLSRYSFVNK